MPEGRALGRAALTQRRGVPVLGVVPFAEQGVAPGRLGVPVSGTSGSRTASRVFAVVNHEPF